MCEPPPPPPPVLAAAAGPGLPVDPFTPAFPVPQGLPAPAEPGEEPLIPPPPPPDFETRDAVILLVAPAPPLPPFEPGLV